MPARMLRTVTQEATEFNQRMGCMAGVFQIFDRHHGLLTARRRGGGRGARGTAPPGPGHDSSSNASVEKSSTSDITLFGCWKQTSFNMILNTYMQDKTFSKSMTDNSCLSVESSKASSSASSVCSSLSSQDSNKPVKQELLDISEEPFVERPTRNSPSLELLKIEAGSTSANTGSGDTTQGSISRDSHDLTVKTSAKEVTNELHKDSLRPLLISKLKWNLFEAQGSKKPSARSRELPRLSLDSRKEYINPSSRPKNVAYTRTDDNLIDALKPQDSPSHRRARSVVAKLMGLEETPRAYEPARSPRTVHDAQNDGQSQPHRMVSPDPTVISAEESVSSTEKQAFFKNSPQSCPLEAAGERCNRI
ncbi:hypothetical protein ACQ4PT_041802 [Festuca glaucescens]